tara:strand:+ start:94 stop:294 length:201 start_codon:yes stop_codon:yes gene_type:complete
MIMCVLVNGEVNCTDYNDSYGKIYDNLAICEKDAAYRFYAMTDIFRQYGTPYEKIVIGCDEADSSS